MSSWFEPDYMKDFRCKAGACRHTCCSGWEIQIGELEYYRLIGMDCSEELHRKLETAFTAPKCPSPEAFRVIRPNWLGNCPMLTEEGLCLLQKECGAEVLPDVCRLYPRSFRQEGDSRRAVCSGSCEAVIELLLPMERLDFRLLESNELPEIRETVEEDYRTVCLRCLRMLRDRSLPVSERIASIARSLGSGIPVTAETVDGMLPTLFELSPELGPYLENAPAEGAADPPWMETLLTNHLLYVDFPFTDRRISVADSAVGLSVCHDLLRRVSGHQGDELTDALTAVFHLAEHTAFYFNTALLAKRAMDGE